MDLTHFTATTLFIGLLTGAIGTGYFMYGKAQGMIVPMLTGAALCIYPFFTDNVWILSIAGVILVIVPFIFKF